MNIKLPELDWLSFSKLKQYIHCGKQFELERIERVEPIPMWAGVGGSAFHTAIEEIDRKMLEENL